MSKQRNVYIVLVLMPDLHEHFYPAYDMLDMLDMFASCWTHVHIQLFSVNESCYSGPWSCTKATRNSRQDDGRCGVTSTRLKGSNQLFHPSTRLKGSHQLFHPSTRLKGNNQLFSPSTRLKGSNQLFHPSSWSTENMDEKKRRLVVRDNSYGESFSLSQWEDVGARSGVWLQGLCEGGGGDESIRFFVR